MKLNFKKLVPVIALGGLAACSNQNAEQNTKASDVVNNKIEEPINIDTNAYQPIVSAIKYEDLLFELNKKDDTLFVVNFWATWCLPCVKELPYFISTSQSMAGTKMKLILVSLDTKDNLEPTLIPYLSKKKWRAKHYLLDDNGRMNEWIAAVNKDWEGSIPATAFYKNGDQLHFNSGQLSQEELKNYINRFITQ
jgi:thiol-disulfide isomerase/thioredoxin